MKKLTLIFLFFSFLIVSSCSDSTTGTGGIGPGGGGSGNVTFQTSIVQNQQTQEFFFQFVPSTSITLNSITVTCPQLQISNQIIPGDSVTVFTSTDPLNLGPVQGLAQGQQWTFVIAGKTGSSTGSNYSTTVNYTVQ